MTEFSSTNQPEHDRVKAPTKGKVMRDALWMALHREAEDSDGKMTKRLHLVADRLVKRAMDDGDVAAIREILDRIDGKVPTAIAGADGEGPVSVSVIERVIIDPKSAD
jgi:hypothetical protein